MKSVKFKRKIYKELLEWKTQSEGESALLIDGARRVGKSFIVKEFAENEYESYIIIDFANVSNFILELIENESYELDLFFAKLSAFYNIQLYNRKSLIIFDEVQLCPRARQLIKYLVADGRYDYIETGSLISLKRNVSNIVIPSEEEHIEMHPMDFEEFLWAIGNTTTMPIIINSFENLKPLGQALHKKIMNDFRKYILVGGMPQAVKEYVLSNDFERTDSVKKRILNLYRMDIGKFADGYESKVKSIFDEIPSQLSKKEKKYKLSSISKSARMRTYEDAFVWLEDAMIINTCFNATDPNVGLALSSEHSTLKCYMADTGILITHTFNEKKYMENELYRNILLDNLNVNEGMIMENIVAQMLKTNGHQLYFYSRIDTIKRANNMEIDFLIRKNNKICPIEVKSSSYRKHTSLDKFRTKFANRIGESYILYQKDVMIKDGVIHLPIYMGMLL